MKVSFVKVQGAGNDFLFLDGRQGTEWLTPALIRLWCHRNFGVGGDGILVLTGVDQGRPVMRIYNSDASVAEMCGNGIRCFARLLHQRLGFTANPMTILTGAGERRCQLLEDAKDGAVRVDMGGVFDESGTPLRPGATPEELVLQGGETVSFLPVSVGNPHAVLWGDFSPEDMRVLGPALSTHPRFPWGTNVEFARVVAPQEIDLVVHERGVGFTLACGTGAQATVGAAVAAGLCPADKPVAVKLPGGILTLSVASDFSSSTMEGPAQEVFEGVLSFE